jgi:hypothetical protein
MKIIWKHFPAGTHGFFRAPILVTGRREAVLIDGGFTLSDGRAVAEAIEATGKMLRCPNNHGRRRSVDTSTRRV